MPIVNMLRTGDRLSNRFKLADEPFPCGLNLRKLRDIRKKQRLEFVRLNMGKKPVLATPHFLNNPCMKAGFNSRGPI